MLTEKQFRFCNEYVMGKDASNSYSIAFNKVNSSSTRAAASRLLKSNEIQSYISELQEQNKKIADLANDKAADKIVEGSIADANERMVTLTKIMRGEIPLTKPMVVDGAIELVPVVPNWSDRMDAIDKLNKMTGDYAATKQDVRLDDQRPSTKIKLTDGTEIEM